MTRITKLSLPTTTREPPPSSVWEMTMALLGAAFGAGSSATSEESVRLTLKRPVR